MNKLQTLYTPSGRAGEYADHGYALNLYNGCLILHAFCAIMRESRKQVKSVAIFVTVVYLVPRSASLLSRQLPGFRSRGTFALREA
jgi:hypothetical protein